jgi:CubicO group peptidase (beta-lactamase class C family)
LQRAEEMARHDGGTGWAAWSGSSEIAGWQTSARGQGLSITKSLAGLAATRASQEGWLHPGEAVAGTIHEWQGDARKRRITVLMLLQQTAGLDAAGSALYHGVIADKGSIAISRQALDEPGRQFRYGPECWEVLAELMNRKLVARGESLENFLHRAVMREIGLSSPQWRSDKKGRFYLSTGVELSVAELGRLGRTLGKLLRGENSEGFDAGHFAEMSRVSGANPMFGAGIWRNANARKASASAIEVEAVLDPPRSSDFWQQSCLSRRQPAEMVALIGSSGRRVFIWPQEKKVVARLGVSHSWTDQPFLNALS